jgi:hypothetical protein
MFNVFLQLGIHHILSWSAYDHILFVTLLTVAYRPRQWKIVLALVTAFTLGHTTSLALATTSYIHVKSALIEWLIVLTILITGIETFFMGDVTDARAFSIKYWFKYGLAMVFGLIHGLGFASYLLALMGKDTSLFIPLLSFNLGVEFGQWVVVLTIMVLGYLLTLIPGMKPGRIIRFVAACGILVALFLLIRRFPWG